MKKVVQTRKDIAFYIKMFPLPMHKEAYGKSKSIVCSGSVKTLDDAFNGKPLPPANCNSNEVDNNIKLAKTMGISGTPAIIFPDDTIWPGSLTAEQIIEFVDKLAPASAPEKK